MEVDGDGFAGGQVGLDDVVGKGDCGLGRGCGNTDGGGLVRTVHSGWQLFVY